MTKQEFIRQVARRSGLSMSDATRVVDAVLDTVTNALKRRDTITFTGFGKFSTSDRAARQGVNPRNPSQKVHIPAASVPKFSAGQALKQAVRAGEGLFEREADFDAPAPAYSHPPRRPSGPNGDDDEPVEPGSEPTPPKGRNREHLLRRTPHLDVQGAQPLPPGEEFAVSVYADTKPPRQGERTRALEITTPTDATHVDLAVWLSVSPQLELLEEKRVKSLAVAFDSERTDDVSFRLRARRNQPASKTQASVTAFFAYKGSGCGSVARTVRVRQPTKMRPRRPRLAVGSLQASTRDQPADLHVHITASSLDAMTFTCTVVTPHLPEYHLGVSDEWKLPMQTGDLVREYMTSFTSANAPDKQRTNRLRAVGKRLFRVSPRVFQSAYWQIQDADVNLRTIAIESQEPYVPWELMIPVRPGESGGDPLGVSYAVGRWLQPNHVGAPQQVALTDSYVIVPTYRGRGNLPNAEAEATLVLRLFGGERVKPPTWSGLDGVFGRGGASLYHFICHGENDGRGIALGAEEGASMDGSLTVIDLEDWPAAQTAFSDRRPFVFLNACEVARTRPSLLGIDGMASAFANLGASCVIAPIWSVDDTAAYDVAQRFYDALSSQNAPALAAILQSIRAMAYNGSGSDTHAAYCFYGSPHTRAAIKA